VCLGLKCATVNTLKRRLAEAAFLGTLCEKLNAVEQCPSVEALLEMFDLRRNAASY
jgi:hypothetical protein